jgi:hypothetical protein
MQELLTSGTDFFARLVMTLVAISLLLRYCYFRSAHSRKYGFALVSFGIGVFFVTYFLHEVEFSMGFAFGLFAIFSMLRYRTESIDIREMTYLFVTITLSLFGAVAPHSLPVLGGAIALLLGIVRLAETILCSEGFEEKQVVYERIENIRPERREELVADLEERLGIEVSEVHVENVDFVRDSAVLKVFIHDGPEPKSHGLFGFRQQPSAGGAGRKSQSNTQVLVGK